MAKILFVDDDEMERYFAREILEPRGHQVHYAGDGEAALRIFTHEDIDVVVTDLAMPKLNGLRLIKQLRNLDRHVRVIAASGINADQLDMAEDLGALAILQKPWDPRRFLDALEKLLAEDPLTAEDFERVWPTAFSDMVIDRKGRLVPREEAESGDEAATGSDEVERDQYHDLGLDDLDLDLEVEAEGEDEDEERGRERLD
jgi:two-component system response regulator (stage 0 sporulation protein F)